MLTYEYVKIIKVSDFAGVCEDMEKRILDAYEIENTRHASWKTASHIANELQFKPITQRETRAISICLSRLRAKKRKSRGFVQFMVSRKLAV